MTTFSEHVMNNPTADQSPHQSRSDSPVPATPVATVVITTKNRRQDLVVALESALRQSVPVEVIVVDDGSTDGTADFVRMTYPSVQLIRHETSGGYINRRNEGAARASSQYIFSIDDDAEFSTPHVVSQTLLDFDHPRIGAVAIPFVDVRKGTTVQQRAAEGTRMPLIGSYIGTAHAVRRDVFLALGGYHADFIHQGEERDYCTRMLAAGYVVRLGRADVIHHYESPKRDLTRMTVYGRRNDILYAWCNVPAPEIGIVLPITIFRGFLDNVKKGYAVASLKGIVAGFTSIPAFYTRRNPLTSKLFWLYRRISTGKGIELTDIESELPALAATQDLVRPGQADGASNIEITPTHLPGQSPRNGTT